MRRTSTLRLRRRRQPRGFLLIMVLLVVSMVSLAALNFSESMLIAHEASRLDSMRFQARMMVESGVQTARIFVAATPAERVEMGGSWDNPQKFQAINIVPSPDPVFRGNVSFMAPSLDQTGVVSGLRYGLQNESSKLNLNALVAIDKMASSMSSAASALGSAMGGATGGAGGAGAGGSGGSGAGGSGAGGGTGGLGGAAAGGASAGAGGGGAGGGRGGGFGGGGGLSGAGFGNQLGSMPTSSLASGDTGTTSQGFGAKMLMGLPGMTEDVADAILDFIDDDEDTRPYGAEYIDYYQQLQPAYKPINGPLTSIEQLLLVRGVTPQLLYGYDQNRNGFLDPSESSQMMMGGAVGGAAGGMQPLPTSNTSTDGSLTTPPSPLGWAPYLTLHSQEKNVAQDGTKRININSDDLQKLYDDLIAAGVNELYASYIIGYRLGGRAPAGAGSPLQTLLASASGASAAGGMLGAQLSQMGGGGAGGVAAGRGGNQGQSQFGQGQTGQPQSGQSRQNNQLGAGANFGQSSGLGQVVGTNTVAAGNNNNQNNNTQNNNTQNNNQNNTSRGTTTTNGTVNTTNTSNGGGNTQQPLIWTASALDGIDLSQQTGSVKFNQVLDLIDSTVVLPGQGQGGGQGGNQGSAQTGNSPTQSGNNAPQNGQNGQQQPTYMSPINGSPMALAVALPIVMDKLTTVESESLPGRINIMECPREILAGIPGMTSELLDSVLQARADGAQSENRQFETWLAVEGLVTIEQMRGFLPLMTCGGDVFKAHVIGYFEGSAPFSRVEAIISGIGATPTVLFYRRLDHFGRGFDVGTLGQRTDVGLAPTVMKR